MKWSTLTAVLTLGLLRDGKQVNVNLELQQSSQNQVDSSSIFNGIEGAEMSNKGKDQGVVVNNVKTGTPAAQIGLKKGDVIIGANQQAVKNTPVTSFCGEKCGDGIPDIVR